MSKQAIEEQWEVILCSTEPRIREMASRAWLNPTLRRLFPYQSMSNLRFSRVVEYPFDALPYIKATSAADRYEARDRDNRPMAEGALDAMVVAVAAAVEGLECSAPVNADDCSAPANAVDEEEPK